MKRHVATAIFLISLSGCGGTTDTGSSSVKHNGAAEDAAQVEATNRVADELEALRVQEQQAETRRRMEEQRAATCARERAMYVPGYTPPSCM